MLAVGPCAVEAVRCENPGAVKVTAIDGPISMIQTGPAQIEVDVVVPAHDLPAAQKLSEAFAGAADVEFAGRPWRVTSCTWFMGEEKSLELTLRGQVPIEKTMEIVAQINSGADTVQVPTAVEQQGPGAQTLKEAGEKKDMEKRVRRNTRLGTMDDLL